MRLINYLISAVLALTIVSCEPVEEETKVFPEITSLDNTLWYSYDSKAQVFYDITYNAGNKGVMLGYSEQDRINEVVNRPFSYTFTPATKDINAIVRVNFEDGQHYGGLLIPKGHFQINLQDVYIIQLYETDAEGEVIYNVDGSMKSTLQMWME
ncbi:MAG: hypothetical protein J6Q62_05695 [Alistipes sp.]|nr:hypothetical protein [Alistipes sp.]